MSTSKGDPRGSVYSNRRLKAGVLLLTLVTLSIAALFGLLLWIFVRSSSLVDARLEEARNRVPTRVYSRPVSIRTRDRMDAPSLSSILNALSYQDTAMPEPGPGEFRLAEHSILVRPRQVPGAVPIPGEAPPSSSIRG